MAFPTGAVNGQEYTSKFGTYYYYSETDNKWVKKGVLFYGSTGAQGPFGQPGLTGIQGATGVQGNTGTQGAQGIAGPTGGPGAQGVTGLAGVIGETGESRVVGYYGSETGVLSVTFDGNETHLVPGLQVSLKVPHVLIIDSWEVVTRETGYFWSDVRTGSYASWQELTTLNNGVTGPYVTATIKNQKDNLSDWSQRTVPGGNYVQFLLQGITGITNLTISLGYHRS